MTKIERQVLAHRYLKARLTDRPYTFRELLADAIEWNLTRDDLFAARRSMDVSVVHGKWLLPETTCGGRGVCERSKAHEPYPCPCRDHEEIQRGVAHCGRA